MNYLLKLSLYRNLMGPHNTLNKLEQICMHVTSHKLLSGSKGGVSKTMSPDEIITGVKLDDTKHRKFQFGDYIMAHNKTNNPNNGRATDLIYLRPTGHKNGGFYVFDLKVARRVHWQSATNARSYDIYCHQPGAQHC